MHTLALLLLFALDINGRWWGNATINGAHNRLYITFVREGDRLRGTGGPTKVDQNPMQNGRIEGNRFIFDIAPGGYSPLHFDIKADGEQLKGTLSVKRNGQTITGPVSLTRRTSD